MDDTPGDGAPDRERVEAWVRGVDGFAEARVVELQPLTEGYSNVTCRLRLADAPVVAGVLKIQPERGIFEPYDVLREGRVLRGLADTAVPVPAVLADDDGTGPIGAPCLLLEWVDAPHMGVPRPDADAAAEFEAFMATVAAIHAVDWRSPGLAFLPVPRSPAQAFADEVEVVARRMAAFGGAEVPLLVEALATLRGATPVEGRLALCQGDCNVFNYLVRGGEVVAVVDWEQARISDPRSDVGQLDALAYLKGVPFGPADEMPIAQLYGAHTGDALVGMALFRAFWLFQLGVVHVAFTTVNEEEPWYSWEQITDLLPRALAALT